jgi:hypothetical protein
MIASCGLLPAFRIGSSEPPWGHFNPIHPELYEEVWLWLFVGAAAAAAQHCSRLGKLISNNIKGCGTTDLRRIQHLVPRTISGSGPLCTNRLNSGLFSEAMPLKNRRAQKSLSGSCLEACR